MRSRTWIALLILAIFASFTFTYLYSKSLQQTTTITVTKTTSITVSLKETEVDHEYEEVVKDILKGVMGWVESHRGLRFKEKVEVVVLTKEWVIQHWGIGFLNRTEVQLEERLLKALFIIPEDFNLTKFKVSRSGYTVAASAGNKIYVVKGLFDPRDKKDAGAVLAHELTHILQGEYFKIPEPTRRDEEQAISALVEGDADLMASHYLLENWGTYKKGFSESYFDPLIALWLFPYIHGKPFIEYVYKKEGWSGVNSLYEDPPRSTAEILHPEKYLNGWRPINISSPISRESGWRLVMQDTLGEYFIRQMLRAHLPGDVANRSAEGWCGDLIQLYEKEGGYVVKWRIAWEAGAEADEFLESFQSLLKEVGAIRTSNNLWKTDVETIEIQVFGNETLITIISPPTELSNEHVEALAQPAAT